MCPKAVGGSNTTNTGSGSGGGRRGRANGGDGVAAAEAEDERRQKQQQAGPSPSQQEGGGGGGGRKSKKASELWHIHGRHFDLTSFLDHHPVSASLVRFVRPLVYKDMFCAPAHCVASIDYLYLPPAPDLFCVFARGRRANERHVWLS